jgi:hypothetical protein
MLPYRHRLVAAGLAVRVLALAPPAHGDGGDVGRAADPPPVSDARKEAARKFSEGTRAFDAGDFTRAGEAFEAAYRFEHHEDPLWNAARAWHHAGDLARAANLYALYLREAPSSAPDRASATAALNQLGPKLSRIEVHLGPGVQGASVDDRPLESFVVYVVPGMHYVRARGDAGDIEKRQAVQPGDTVSVLLVSPRPERREPASPASAPAVSPPPSQPSIATPPVSRSGSEIAPRGWSPIVVAVEGAVTLGVAGLAVWSGLETLGTLRAFRSEPTQASLDTGRGQEVRTNVLIGASVGFAAITGITAIWLVDWGGRRRSVEAAIGPGLASVRGTF